MLIFDDDGGSMIVRIHTAWRRCICDCRLGRGGRKAGSSPAPVSFEGVNVLLNAMLFELLLSQWEMLGTVSLSLVMSLLIICYIYGSLTHTHCLLTTASNFQ